MSESRKVHPGLFRVLIGLGFAWYFGLGIGFTFFSHTKLTSATAYEVISNYIPLMYWGIVYLILGTALIICTLIKSIPHVSVQILSGVGLVLTTSWITTFIVDIVIGKMDTISVIPAWTMIAMVEWATLNEPYHGPKQ